MNAGVFGLTSTRPTRKTPARRTSHRRAPARRPRGLGWRARTVLAVAAAVLVLLGWGAIARLLAPKSNTALNRFDAIIVLGTPADSDGNPTPEQLARVGEAVHEYDLGVAPRLILTGGAAHNGFVEAQVMARTAEAEGIPASAIYLEPEARDTIQNACYSARIMKAHGWGSAEVISSASHLPRAGILFSSLPLEWRTHAAPSLSGQTSAYVGAAASVEALKTVRYLIWGRWMERCEP